MQIEKQKIEHNKKDEGNDGVVCPAFDLDVLQLLNY